MRASFCSRSCRRGSCSDEALEALKHQLKEQNLEGLLVADLVPSLFPAEAPRLAEAPEDEALGDGEEVYVPPIEEYEEAEQEEWAPSAEQLKDLKLAHDNLGHPRPSS